MAKDLNISLLLDFYGSMLTEKQRRIVEYYYDDDLSLSEIAENEGITRQGVHDFVRRAEEQLLEMEQRLGLARRFREMSDGLREIENAASGIRDYNEHFIYAREIDENAKRILEITRRLCE